MRVTPCGVCGDKEGYVGVQLGKEVICEACVRAFPWFLSSLEPSVADVIWGPDLPESLRPAVMLRALTSGLGPDAADAQTHRDLAIAYEQMGLVDEARMERACAEGLSARSARLEHLAEQLGMLMASAKQRGTLPILLREMGLHARSRGSS